MISLVVSPLIIWRQYFKIIYTPWILLKWKPIKVFEHILFSTLDGSHDGVKELNKWKWYHKSIPNFNKVIGKKYFSVVQPYLSVEKTALLSQVLTGADVTLPLFNCSTPSYVWLIVLSQPGKPGCCSGMRNEKKVVRKDSTEIVSVTLFFRVLITLTFQNLFVEQKRFCIVVFIWERMLSK